ARARSRAAAALLQSTREHWPSEGSISCSRYAGVHPHTRRSMSSASPSSHGSSLLELPKHAAQNFVLHALLGRPNDPTFHVCPHRVLHRQGPIKKVLAAKRARFG